MLAENLTLTTRNGGPIKNPVFDAVVGFRSRLGGALERSLDLGLPVALDEILEILAIGWSRVWDVVIREPTLKFGFVPFVVGCYKSVY